MGVKRYSKKAATSAVRKHEHIVLDQRKSNVAKRYFGVDSEKQRLSKTLRPLKGVLKGDTRPWPYR